MLATLSVDPLTTLAHDYPLLVNPAHFPLLVSVCSGRVRIGYQIALKLLRAGAIVLVTSRYPHDAAARYAEEPDFGTWQERL